MSDWQKYYRFYQDKKEYGGTDVFDLWAGDLTEEEAREFVAKTSNNRYGVVDLRNKQGISYVPEDSFIIYLHHLKSVMSDFEWHGWNRFTNAQCRKLLMCLESMKTALDSSENAEALNATCGGHLPSDDKWDFSSKKARVKLMIEDFIDIVQAAVKNSTSLWVNGL
jgi:hypothetical protein